MRVPPSSDSFADAAKAWLAFYAAIGCDEAILDAPVDRRRPPPPPGSAPAASAPPRSSRGAVGASPAARASAPGLGGPPRAGTQGPGGRDPGYAFSDAPDPTRDAEAAAAAASDLAALDEAIRAFRGCPLAGVARNTVISDGVADAAVLVIGEAPGEEEDRRGLPFVGPSGQLLDKMLAAIGLSRGRNTQISNVVFWRPPGNRKPLPGETAVCLPFVRRRAVLLQPKLVILAGGAAASTVLNTPEGVTKLRGRWFDWRPDPAAPAIPAMPIFHPSFLLRQPASKREAWMDLLAIDARLTALGVAR